MKWEGYIVLCAGRPMRLYKDGLLFISHSGRAATVFKTRPAALRACGRTRLHRQELGLVDSDDNYRVEKVRFDHAH